MFKSSRAKIPKNKSIPTNKALFVVGDIHGEANLLKKLFREIQYKIYKLPFYIQKEIIFVGDYIDRGSNSKETITFLINLQKKITRLKNIKILFLCGNHDEFFYKFINAENIIKIEEKELDLKKNPLQDLLFTNGKNIPISGLKRWINIGGGLTTIRDYCPQIKDEMFKLISKNETMKSKDLIKLNRLFKILKDSVPNSHKLFFKNVFNNLYYQIGNFLIIHAGIFPNKKLSDQGIGKNVKKLDELSFLKLIMIRDEFLWTEKLHKCKFYVIHGHTPSEILRNNMIIAYTYKNFRLCLDTKIYDKNGSITYFYKYKKEEYCLSISKKNSISKCVY